MWMEVVKKARAKGTGYPSEKLDSKRIGQRLYDVDMVERCETSTGGSLPFSESLQEHGGAHPPRILPFCGHLREAEHRMPQ